MNYEEFLLSQLLRDKIEEFDMIAYDTLFEESKKIYNDFKKFDKLNNYKYNLYESIEEYILINKNDLKELIKKFYN